MPTLPEKYAAIWDKSLPFLEAGRPGDVAHAAETAAAVLAYRGPVAIDLDVLVPVAIMHDIGHGAILPEHFTYITGPDKLKNGKLVHMLAGAKIAKDILTAVGYDAAKAEEIVAAISMHDADQLTGIDRERAYDTPSKKLFHDLDCSDRFNERRIADMAKMFPDRDKLLALLQESLKDIFYEDFRAAAEAKLEGLRRGQEKNDN
jgi:hypothetical protein